MAPVNGVTGKPAKPSAKRAPSKPVVPVLPLTYTQRPTSKPAPALPTSSAPVQRPHNQEAANEKSGEAEVREPHEPPAENTDKLGPAATESPDVVTPAAPPPIQTPVTSERGAPTVVAGEKTADTPTPPPASVTQPEPSHTPPRSSPSRPPSTSIKNPTTHYTARNAIPAPQPAVVNPTGFHQAHASNGSLVFGGFHGSNASSPAPHPTGGYPPPGFMPYPPATMPVAPVDGYGRPLLVSPTLDGYPPSSANHHGPPTPHSFQGSHSSAQAEEPGLSQHPLTNGHNPNGYAAEATGHSGMYTYPGFAVDSGPSYQNMRNQDETLRCLQEAFSDNIYADCMLEVHFINSALFRDHPDYQHMSLSLATPGHRLIFSRSRTLARAMKMQRTPPGGTLQLVCEDETMRPDVFFYAVRSLYGFSLGDGILPTDLRPRNLVDDFKLTLSYIATAHYLQLGWVQSLAVQRATRLLCWETIELVLKFSLPALVLPAPNHEYPFSELLEHALAFITQNFPKDFALDRDAGECTFPRLPPFDPPSRNPNAPTIAHGTSGTAYTHNRQSSATQTNMPRNSRLSINPRLSQIKFGDVTPPVRNGYGGHSERHPELLPSRRTPMGVESVLTRILLNLPFELLKRVLEHPDLAKSTGEIDQYARHQMITDIVSGREKRRHQALDRGIPQLRVLQETLDKLTAPLPVTRICDYYVNNMGFKEEVFPGDVPFLIHTWENGGAGSSTG
ncbi:hypothetical protein QBC46DRAFT_69513 [Diplogelasinospora grovesii]|uniref:BTB domain-containing protein n=1 Tax=Diplogelasinospora grovesii TaxID=303347 RepID=A0AAN6NCR4_9PEZI|nr:hypothetical protein QBC46DRAFT_69513 [Diplogelasinospora grovesii]